MDVGQTDAGVTVEIRVSSLTADPARTWNDQLATLFRSYRPALTRFFGRHAPNKTDVPDLVQDVYLKLSTTAIPANLDRPDGYVISVARSILIDHHRRRQVRHSDQHGPLTDDIIGTDLSAERVIDSKAAADAMQAALHELPDRTQDVFALRTVQGMKMADVAELMQVSLSTAEKHHARAMAHLATRLKDFR